MHRTHTCSELRGAHIGQEVTLSGWVTGRRDHGGIIFIDLRDRYGITQMVFDPEISANAWKQADTFRQEYCVKLTGKVRERPTGQQNSNLETGAIEVIVSEVVIHSKSLTPPFEISDSCATNEETRFTYRYLDIRRAVVQKKLQFRARLNQFTRNWFTASGFCEIQTPIFTASSPEGARDYVIPSRLHPGKFYALPQAPQQYKQLLMIGGMDKYFQIAPCFRDEDPRADRHSCEFYQIDCEMSFVEQDDIFQVAEKFIRELLAAEAPQKRILELGISGRFHQLTHKQAKDWYGSDKPDLRFDLKFVDLSTAFATSGFSVFADAVKQGGGVKAMKLSGKILSRSQIDELTKVAQSEGAKGLAYIIYEAEGPRSPILKFFTGNELEVLQNTLEPKTGDMIFFSAGDYETSIKSLGKVRLALRDMCDLAQTDDMAFVWVTDFPMFEEKSDGSIDFEHNPFSMPHGGAVAFDAEDPLSIYGMQYDMACNGYEILSGSIRNHDLEALVKAFKIVGKTEQDVKDRFGAMYSAFQYGVPPHGGFAFGFDRLLMILSGESNIREIYAFPKSGKAEDLMMRAPTTLDAEQLEELHIQIAEND